MRGRADFVRVHGEMMNSLAGMLIFFFLSACEILNCAPPPPPPIPSVCSLEKTSLRMFHFPGGSLISFLGYEQSIGSSLKKEKQN